MIKHAIMIKLKDRSDESKQAAKNMLLSMDGKVQMMRSFEVCCDFIGSERSYDVFLCCTLDDEKALEDYQNDKYHCEIKAYIKTVAESVIAVDSYV
ncbi:MAG: Dabb family protein [Ruminococcaceae bacterium]|nr:Dabb family protein [Oscillospiraceae bacterium]